MKISLNNKDVKEVDSELSCINCVLYTYNFCPCHFDRDSIMIEDFFLSKIFSL